MKKILILLLLYLFVVSVSAQSITIPIQDGATIIKVLECTDGLCHLGNEFDCDGLNTLNYDIIHSDATCIEYYFDGNSDDVHEIQIQQSEIDSNKMENKTLPLLWIWLPIVIGIIAILLWLVYGRKKES